MTIFRSPAFWIASSMIIGAMSTALISPLYPIYQNVWQLPVVQISLIYVVYMLGTLTGLLSFGSLSNILGIQRVLKIGLALTLATTALSMFAWNVSSLLIARYGVGIGSSLLTITGTVGLVQLVPIEKRPQWTTIASVLLAFGFGLGPLLGGVIGQWISYPLIIAYIPVLILGTITFATLMRVQLPIHEPSVPTWKSIVAHSIPKLTLPEKTHQKLYVLSCSFPFIAFGVFGLYASMAPLFLENMLPWHGPIIGGGAITVILFMSAFMQAVCSRLSQRTSATLGMLALAISNAIMIINLKLGSFTLFSVSVMITAFGHGLSMLTGSNIINNIAGPNNRSGLTATYWVAGYIGAIVPMMIMGWISDHWGFNASVISFCAAVVIACISIITLALKTKALR